MNGKLKHDECLEQGYGKVKQEGRSQLGQQAFVTLSSLFLHIPQG
jgi:hypothetical protein